jgi:hypothetical protein
MRFSKLLGKRPEREACGLLGRLLLKRFDGDDPMPISTREARGLIDRRHQRFGRRWAAYLGGGVVLLALPYVGYVAVTWFRFGTVDTATPDALLDRFIPHYEVAERHHTRVAAPANVTFDASVGLDLQGSRANRAIFAVRTLPARLLGEPVHREASSGILAEMLALGWGILAEVPGRRVVIGAVTQPWAASVEFRALPPGEFAAFHEPGYAKIVWTLEAEPISDGESFARTDTRVVTTDPVSRERFRRYWSLVSPGVLLIRREALRLIRAEAERRHRTITLPP